MKKSVKIIVSIIIILLVLVAAVCLICPGLFMRLYVKHKYPDVDRKLDNFAKTDVSDEFISCNIDGISFYAPSELEKIPGDDNLYKGDGIIVSVTERKLLNETVSKDVHEKEKKKYDHFFKAIDHEPVYSEPELIIFICEELDSDMCMKLGITDMKLYKDWAASKQVFFESGDMWHYDGESFKGYVSKDGSGINNMPSWNFDIYPVSSTDHAVTFTVAAKDEATAKKILGSVKLEK